MPEILARGFTFTIDGTAIGGINSFSIGSDKADADTTKFSNQGHRSHLPASRGKTVTLSGLYQEDPDTGARDAGQAAVELLAEKVGYDGMAEFVITSPGGNTKTFDASAKMADLGGGNDDPTSWGVELTVDGEVTDA